MLSEYAQRDVVNVYEIRDPLAWMRGQQEFFRADTVARLRNNHNRIGPVSGVRSVRFESHDERNDDNQSELILIQHAIIDHD